MDHFLDLQAIDFILYLRTPIGIISYLIWRSPQEGIESFLFCLYRPKEYAFGDHVLLRQPVLHQQQVSSEP